MSGVMDVFHAYTQFSRKDVRRLDNSRKYTTSQTILRLEAMAIATGVSGKATDWNTLLLKGKL